MAQGIIEVKFQAKGNKAVTQAVIALDMATKRLEGTTSEYERELKKLGFTTKQQVQLFKKQTGINALGVKNNRLLANSFATLRSKMLLASFAVGVLNAGMVSFVRTFAEAEALERGFDNLSDSIESSSQMFEKLQQATDGTISKTQIFKSANNAMMLGVVKSEDEMAKLFDTAQRLGQALGVDTARSIESIVTGMGRQSRLMLDNLGIIVKSSEAYENYANSIGKSVDELTDSQKKEAFNEEVLRKSAELVENLGEEQLNAASSIQQMGVAFENISIVVGQTLAPALQQIAKLAKSFGENLQPADLRKIATAVGVVGGAFLLLKVNIEKAIFASAQYMASNKLLLAAMAGLTVAIEIADRVFDVFGRTVEEGTEKINENKNAKEQMSEADKLLVEQEENARIAAENLNKEQIESERVLRNKLLMLEATSDKEKMILKITKDRANGIDDLSRSEEALIDLYIRKKEEMQIIQTLQEADAKSLKDLFLQNNKVGNSVQILDARTKEQLETLNGKELTEKELLAIQRAQIGLLDNTGKLTRQLTEFEIENILQIHRSIEATKEQNEIEKEKKRVREELIATTQNLLQFQIDSARESADARIEEINRVEQRELESLRASRRFQRASDQQKKKLEQEIIDRHDKQEKAERNKANKRMKENFRIQQAISATETIISAHKGAALAIGQKGFFGLTMAQVILAQGYASAGLIMAQKPPKMRYGGSVGGNRHSQGGTMIEAERGEFVMRREAVDAVGLETMNRINEGNFGGGVNISINNPILSKDVVEDDLIPQIKEAIRRGADIGVG